MAWGNYANLPDRKSVKRVCTDVDFLFGNLSKWSHYCCAVQELLDDQARQYRSKKLGAGADTTQTENVVNSPSSPVDNARGKKLQVLSIKEL